MPTPERRTRRKKFEQKNAVGCKICGDPSVGRGIQRHVEDGHGITYPDYLKCFSGGGRILTDEMAVSGTTANGQRNVVIHTLVRRFEVPKT